MMTQLAEAYRKIRNTFRFALSNLNDFDPARDIVHDADMWEMDAWMHRRTGALVRQCLDWYASFEFHRVYHALHDFCSVDLSAFYFDVLKDRLYTFAPNSRGRRSAQTAVYHIARALVRLIAPILVFTSEEIWKHFPHEANAPASVHMSSFSAPETFENAFDEARAKNWETLLEIRGEVLNALETARANKIIGSALEAKVSVYPRTDLQPQVKDDVLRILSTYKDQLRALLIVSQVDITPELSTDAATTLESSRGGKVVIGVERAQGKKCERCWNYSTHVGENADYPTICERCTAALAEIERDGGNRAGSAAS